MKTTSEQGERLADFLPRLSPEAEEGTVCWALTAITVVISLFAVAPAAASEKAPQIVSILRNDANDGFSGAVLVARGDKIVFDDAYGAEDHVKMRVNSRFWIASAGKQFVSAAILKCQEHGWLSLGDPISRFLPNVPADKSAISLRQLLAHISGLDQTYASEGVADRNEAVSRILSKPLIDRPGNKFHYSNDNYELAAAIVEIASGEDYHSFVEKNLWHPAGMHDTGFSTMPGAKSVVPARHPLPPRIQQIKRGEAGVYSTTHDLLAWYRALRAGRILSLQSVALLFAPVTRTGEGQSGLGWFLGTTPRGSSVIFTRGNEDFGPNCLIYAYPESETLIIVLTHAGDATPNDSWSRFVLAHLEKALAL